MRIYRTKHFAEGVSFVVFALICLVLVAFQGFNALYCAAAVVLLALAGFKLMKCFSQRDIDGILPERLMEKDGYVIQKSAYTVMRIFCIALHAAMLILLIAYWAVKLPALMAAVITLCGVDVFLFIVILLVNGHYEEH